MSSVAADEFVLLKEVQQVCLLVAMVRCSFMDLFVCCLTSWQYIPTQVSKEWVWLQNTACVHTSVVVTLVHSRFKSEWMSGRVMAW